MTKIITTSEALDDLRSRILSHYTLLFLETYEEDRWEAELSNLASELERGLVIWSVTDGPQPPPGDAREGAADPLEFLEQIAAYPRGHLFLLKDFHPFLQDARIVRKLRDLTARLTAEDKTLLFIGPVCKIPVELRKQAAGLELPLPGLEELRRELSAVLKEQTAVTGRKLQPAPAEEERMLKAVLGLTAGEARKALARALWNRETIDDDVYAALVSEKKNMVAGSDLLEFYELEDGVADIGGLEGLKDWIAQRAEAFSTRAREQGIPMPKGVMLLGVQGCGKSLTARATARLLSFPLVRLDASNLLSSDRGASEKNMRSVLGLMETIAPAVLWLDEIEKGFAGSDGAGGDATMSRIVGRFLTWMEEKKSPVFVIATANSIHALPPELLRRGRFDELFFVDLPNYEERKQIFRIHLAKRDWKPEKYDIEQLADLTEGYSGAEIEQIVIAAMLETFGQGRILSQQDLKRACEDAVPLSVTMEEKIFELREWARTRCRPATPDSRVMQMIDEERRQVEFDLEDDAGESVQSHEWVALAEHGQLSAAVVEYVRLRDRVTFPQLQDAFVEYVETVGDQGLALRSDPNVVLWLTLSAELAGVLSKLIAAKKLYVHPVSADVYKSNGHGLRLPLLEELTDERLPRPMWLPVCLRDLAPDDDNAGRFARVARMKLSK